MTFPEIIFLDFEYRCPDGCRPVPHCLVWRRWGDPVAHHEWLDPAPLQPPFDTQNALLVAYNFVAEASCFLALGWELPRHVLDLYVEFRQRANNTLPSYGLLQALEYFGLGSIDSATKEHWRGVAIRGGPFTPEERQGLLAYCQTDVDELYELYETMIGKVDLSRALHRGNYMLEVAKFEHRGIPMDVDLYDRIRTHWEPIKRHLVAAMDKDFGVFDGIVFKHDRFAEMVTRRGYEWDLTECGRLCTDDDYMRGRAQSYPELEPLRQLLGLLDQFKRMQIAVGPDGRNRASIMPFGTKTGRNAPRARHSLFAGPRWIRGLIRPEPGHALAYIDWSSQEFGIMAALSQDANMLDSYNSGDPYLSFARHAGAVPADATKESHPAERARYKRAALAVNYGQGYKSLARDLGVPTAYARKLMRDHREVYPDMWRWLEAMQDDAALSLRARSVHGWQLRIDDQVGHRTVDNFFAQANGAEMLRLACTMLDGVRCVLPVHDALLIEADVGEIDEAVRTTQRVMSDASEAMLRGRLRLRTDVVVYGPGDRVLDEGGLDMWNRVLRELQRAEGSVLICTGGVCRSAQGVCADLHRGVCADLHTPGSSLRDR